MGSGKNECGIIAVNLDGYISLQPCVAGAVDFAHPACAERRRDLIGPKLCAWSERRKWLRL
jgi:hypothetical protein